MTSWKKIRTWELISRFSTLIFYISFYDWGVILWIYVRCIDIGSLIFLANLLKEMREFKIINPLSQMINFIQIAKCAYFYFAKGGHFLKFIMLNSSLTDNFVIKYILFIAKGFCNLNNTEFKICSKVDRNWKLQKLSHLS